MSELITTLHKKEDASVDVYPNIKRDNIPSGAINTSKIEDGSITESKIVDGAVSTDKLALESVTFNELDTSLKDAYNNFNSIYDDDEGELTISSLTVNDDASIHNLTIDNNLIVGSKTIEPLYTHCIQVQLTDTNNNVTSNFKINVLSTLSTAIYTFNELTSLLSKYEGLVLAQTDYDMMGYISNVELNTRISIYSSSDGSTLAEYDYVTMGTITDKVSSLYD